jgi:hypothetical protein
VCIEGADAHTSVDKLLSWFVSGSQWMEAPTAGRFSGLARSENAIVRQGSWRPWRPCHKWIGYQNGPRRRIVDKRQVGREAEFTAGQIFKNRLRGSFMISPHRSITALQPKTLASYCALGSQSLQKEWGLRLNSVQGEICTIGNISYT